MSHTFLPVQGPRDFISADIKSQKVRTLEAVADAFSVLGDWGVAILFFHVFSAPYNIVGSCRYNIVQQRMKKETG